jgi:hypothetical protein
MLQLNTNERLNAADAAQRVSGVQLSALGSNTGALVWHPSADQHCQVLWSALLTHCCCCCSAALLQSQEGDDYDGLGCERPDAGRLGTLTAVLVPSPGSVLALERMRSWHVPANTTRGNCDAAVLYSSSAVLGNRCRQEYWYSQHQAVANSPAACCCFCTAQTHCLAVLTPRQARSPRTCLSAQHCRC